MSLFRLLRRGVSIAQIALKSRHLKQHENERVKSAARDYLIQSMGKMKGLPNKVGQMLSMSDKLSPENEFTALCNQGEPIAMDLVLAILAESWQQDPYKIIDWIDEKPMAASLGQVHRAKLRKGGEVAIKVRYPEIEEAIKTDLKLLGWLGVPFGGMRRGFDMDSYQEEILNNIKRELDYIHEMNTQEQFHRFAQSDTVQGWVVPRPVVELCRENVLVAEWEEGEPFSKVREEWSEEHRFQVEKIMASIFFHTLFDQGLFHADPNPGNYSFRQNGNQVEVVMYDFGCTGSLEKQDRLYLLKLFQDARDQRGNNPFPLYTGLGFSDDFLEPMAEKLPTLTEMLLEPFLSDGKYDFTTWNRSERAADILGDDRWNFRVAAPAKSIFLLRAFVGLIYYLGHLRCPIWLYPWIKELLERNSDSLNNLKLEERKELTTWNHMAQYLKIRVEDQGELKVQLTFKRKVIENLESVMPDDMMEKIESRNIDLPGIIARCRQNLYQPQELFSLVLSEEKKKIRIWLE